MAGVRLLRNTEPGPSSDVDINVSSRADGTTLVKVAGELDLSSVPQLRACLSDLVNRGEVQLEVDLSAVTFCDSTALGVFVGAHRRTAAGNGHVRFANPPSALRNLLEVSGLDQILDVT